MPRVCRRQGRVHDPRVLGTVFAVVGLAVALTWDRSLQTWILDHSPIAPWQVDSGFIPEG